jgi:hypothetical protein
MDVKVNNCHPPAVLPLTQRVQRTHSHVIEEAEAAGHSVVKQSGRSGVVARRPHAAECVPRLALEDCVDRRHHRALCRNVTLSFSTFPRVCPEPVLVK